MSSTPSYPRRKKSETIANQIIGRVIYDKYEPAILNELTNLTEYIEQRNYSPAEIAQYLPHFADRSLAEMVMIHKEVYHQLSLRLKTSDLTFLQTYRTYIALKAMEPEKNISMSNPRIKFCAKYYITDPALNLRDSFKTIALIDNCMMAAQKN